jgi:hypothetical protein
VEITDTEILRCHEGWESTPGLSAPGRFGGGRVLIDLRRISGKSIGRLERVETDQVFMMMSLIILTRDVDAVLKLAMYNSIIAVVLLGIGIRVLRNQR